MILRVTVPGKGCSMTLEFDSQKNYRKIKDPLHKQIYRKAEPFLQVRSNNIHARVSYHYALTLLETEGGDPAIVLPAILLHDTGYAKLPPDQLHFAFVPGREKPELRRLHEVEGARLAREILLSIDYPEEYIQSIEAIIDGHDTREDALNENDKIVQDADKLFRFTYEGCVLASSYIDCASREFLNYLNARIPVWLFTEAARQLALEQIEQRQNDYLKRL